MGDVLARNLDLPLEPALVKKIGHPTNPEYAIGATSLQDYVVDKIPGGVADDYAGAEVQRLQKLLADRLQKYTGRREPVEVTGKIVILVDDGLATGQTVLMTIKSLRAQDPKKLVVATPVASPVAASQVSKVADELIVLDIPENFLAVGQFYEQFDQVGDEEVEEVFRHRFDV
jgi:predicted phosphoribosyltransferase